VLAIARGDDQSLPGMIRTFTRATAIQLAHAREA
jgi:hypothetical protein